MYIIITPVTVEPVSLGELKTHSRLPDETSEDDFYLSLITAAREYCEKLSRRALALQTIELVLDYWPECDRIELPYPPLVSVTSIKYKDCAGVETTISAADYIVDTDSYIGRVVPAYGVRWPEFTPYPVNAIRIRYVAGYANAPEVFRQAIKMLVGHWIENREAVGDVSAKMKFAVEALLMVDRAGWF